MPVKKKLSRPVTRNNSKFSEIQSRIKPVTSLGLTLACLFYGRAGTGKTTIASTFPKPILHLDIRDKGTDSVSDVKGFETIQIEEWDDFEQLYWLLASKENKYKTVVVDPISSLQDFAILQVLKEDGKQEGDPVSKRHWGKVSGLMKTWITNYRDLIDRDINVVFLAHDRASDGEEGDEGELMPSVGPRLMPSVGSYLNGAVKIIGNTFIRESHEKLGGGRVKRRVAYCLRIGPHAYYTTKIRQPKSAYTPEVLEDPSYNDLVSIMKGDFEAPAPKEPVTSKLKRRK